MADPTPYLLNAQRIGETTSITLPDPRQLETLTNYINNLSKLKRWVNANLINESILNL